MIVFFFQALANQKRKTEEEKSQVQCIKRENQSLIDSCDELEKKRTKLEHELHTKDTHIACLEGQVSSAKKILLTEQNRVFIISLQL